MRIELLYFDDCPNWEVAAGLLDELAADRGDLMVERRVVNSDEEARRLGFFGSPSIQIDGVDLFEPPAEGVPGLSCRVYHTETGLSGAPSRAQLQAAIERACGSGSPS